MPNDARVRYASPQPGLSLTWTLFPVSGSGAGLEGVLCMYVLADFFTLLFFQEGKSHEGTKPCKVVFCGKMNRLFSTGFSKMSDRQYGFWDPSNLSKSLTLQNIDTSSGVLFPFWDEGTGVVYLAGKVNCVYLRKPTGPKTKRNWNFILAPTCVSLAYMYLPFSGGHSDQALRSDGRTTLCVLSEYASAHCSASWGSMHAQA